MTSRTHDVFAFASLITAATNYPPSSLNTTTLVRGGFIGGILFAVLICFGQFKNKGVKRVSQETSLATLLLASFSYFGVFILLPLIFKNSHPFVRFHLKQGILTLSLLVGSIFLAKIWLPLGIVSHVAVWLVIILAMIQASRGYCWPLPFVKNKK